ncbi:MAG: DNA polymerase domain-containing protein [Deltaproteobacteria bacterium]|nr:DNA polymerase domain-containing protein [Deltaproteobacteria bacterium]MDZ4341173.1 DNA polymerase domain-containing protein [Candidatus Binatia bacterium]
MNERKQQLPPVFQKNEILFGHDSTPALIAFEIEGANQVKIFSRDDKQILTASAPFEPLLLLDGEADLKGWKGEAKIETLSGDGAFNRLALFPDLKQLDDARSHLQKQTGKSPSASDAPYWYFSDPLHQYLLLSGKTHFIGMTFSDLKRMQLDIETYCQAGFEFPNAARESDRITAIALSDSTGWERLISGKEYGEAEMLGEMVKEIRQRDPDVIEGHNLFRFDLEYIDARVKRHKVNLGVGRDGSPLTGHASRMQIAERSITYRKYEIFGRHIIDTWILAQHYDVATRELESFGLKDIARHFGIAGADRTYVPGNRTSWYFDHDPDTLFRYALDDVRETRAISDLLSPSYFVEAQIFPYSYQNVPLRGNATKIDALFLREYLHQRRAVPRADEGREVAGGFTDMEHQGTARHVLHCDVTSLYPSIMLVYNYLPKKDDLGVFTGLLRDLRAFRVKAKELGRDARDDESKIYFNALQSTFKILINSFYGYLGFQMGHFNDFEAANRVTAKGRELIQSAVAWLKQKGAKIIEVDTDGIYFVPPEGIRTPKDEEDLIAKLGEILPKGIELELDGRYPAMFSYKMKNYALLDEQGRLRIKGSGLRSRGLELFQREWLEEMLALLLKDEREKIAELYRRYLDDLENHRRDISWIAKTETLQDSLDNYQAKVKAKKRNAAAPYELALKAERPYQPGDQISYYVTGTKAKVKISGNCKLASQWDANNPDENVEHYKAKLDELYEKFRPFIEDDKQGKLSAES